MADGASAAARLLIVPRAAIVTLDHVSTGPMAGTKTRCLFLFHSSSLAVGLERNGCEARKSVPESWEPRHPPVDSLNARAEHLPCSGPCR